MAKQRHIFGRHLDDWSDTTEVVPGVFVDPGNNVTIIDDQGIVTSWSADEWAEDPDAVTACVNASILAAAKGSAAVRANIGNGETLRDLIDETMAKVRPDGNQTVIVPLEGYTITLKLGPPNREGIRAGEIETDLTERLDITDGDDEWRGAVDAYIRALQTVMDALINNMD